MGTDIAGFYYDLEMVPGWDSSDDITRDGDMGPGKWYRGKIVSERWTDKNDLVYECVFDTPLQHSHWYTENYAHKAVQSFQDEMVAHGWQSSSAPASFVSEDLTVGDYVTRWFTITDLPKNFVDKEGVQGAYVEGIIIDIDCKKKKPVQMFV